VLDGVAVNLAAHASMDRSSIGNTARAVRAEEGGARHGQRQHVDDNTIAIFTRSNVVPGTVVDVAMGGSLTPASGI
jgi:hypothetical protein